MHGAASAGVGDPERLGDHLRNAPYVRHHPRLLGGGKRHSDLVDLLHRSASQLRQGSGAADRQQRALRVHGVAEAGDSVGEARGGVHRDAWAAGNPAPRVGHVHRALLVAGVDEPEAHVVHDVEQRQDVVAGEGEHGVDARSPKRCADELTSGQPSCRTHSDPPIRSWRPFAFGIVRDEGMAATVDTLRRLANGLGGWHPPHSSRGPWAVKRLGPPFRLRAAAAGSIRIVSAPSGGVCGRPISGSL